MPGADRPWVMKLNANLYMHPQNGKLQELHAWVIRQQAQRFHCNEVDAFYPNYPPLTQSLDVNIGAVELPDHPIFGPSLDACLRNIGIVGPTGWGKPSADLTIASTSAQ